MAQADTFTLIVSFIAGALVCWGVARRRYWWAGQIAMKQRIRQQLNHAIEAGNLSIKFRDGSSISAEQLLDFMCYGKVPDPADPTRGVSTYNPH